MVVNKVDDLAALRERENIAAKAESAAAAIDYLYLMTGTDPLESEEVSDGDASAEALS